MKTKILNALLAAGITVGTLSTVAFADTGSSFDSQYQANVTLETQLLQQAQSANSTDTTVEALLSTAQNINQQVSSLYTTEQTLSAGKASIPSVSADDADKTELAKLEKERTTLLNQSNSEWNLVKKYDHHKKDKQLLNKAMKEHNATQKKLNEIDKQIKDLEGKMDKGDWKDHPYDGGFTALKEAILRLQDSSIHYTKEAIKLEQSDSATANTTNSTATNNSSSSSSSNTTDSTSAGAGTTTGGTTTSSTTSSN